LVTAFFLFIAYRQWEKSFRCQSLFLVFKVYFEEWEESI
jgi:hypothetical protein